MLDFIASIEWQQLALDCAFSLMRVLVGTFLACVAGVSLAIIRNALPKWLRCLLFPFMELPKYIAPLAWLPYATLVFGIGEPSAISIVFVGAFFPILTAAGDALDSVPWSYRQFARSLEISRIKYLWQVAFPASLPRIMSGFRLGVMVGWYALVAAEMLAGPLGLGYALNLNKLNMQYGSMNVDMIFISIMGIIVIRGSLILERKLVPWERRERYE